jgi:hypothetical protein
MTQSRSRLSRNATQDRFAQDAEDTAARERTIQAAMAVGRSGKEIDTLVAATGEIIDIP